MAFYRVYNSREPNDNNDKKVPLGIIIVMFVLGLWPIGFMLILWNAYVSGKLGSKKDRATRQQWDNATQPETLNAEQRKARSRSLRVRKILANTFLGIGILAGICAVPGLLETLDDLRWGFFDHYTLQYDLIPAMYAMVTCGAMSFFGGRIKRDLRLEKLMTAITGDKAHISIEELSAASGYDKRKTMELVKAAISHDLFGPTAYIDMRTETLVVRGDAPKPRPQAPKKEPSPATEKNADRRKYQKILRQLREVNDAIPGEEMSAKIDQLEDISTRIFTLAEKDPDKKPQLSRFMDYYLPTALKLLDTYATLDQQGLAGENVTATKASIENAMDMLVDAFAGQLDKLFQSDALDVSSDIAALQSMLTMDGLTQDELFDAAPQAPTFPAK